jgi:hypothetical protein
MALVAIASHATNGRLNGASVKFGLEEAAGFLVLADLVVTVSTYWVWQIL